MSPDLHSRLLDRYSAFCARGPGAAATARNNLLWIALTLVIMPFAVMGFMAAIDQGSPGYPDLLVPMVLSLALKSLLTVTVFVKARRRRRALTAELLHSSRPLDRSRVPSLRAMLDRLCSKMGIDPTRFDLRFLRNEARLPSMFWAGGRDYLLFPAGFVNEAERDPAAAEAILAHELGHIKQGDVGLWMTSLAYYPAIGTALSIEVGMVAFNGLLMLVGWLMSYSVHETLSLRDIAQVFVRGAAPLMLAIYHRSAFQRARATSEIAADIASILFCDGHSLSRAVAKLREEVAADSPHLAREERLALIKSVLEGEIETWELQGFNESR
jgi:Zn-dependent protease with chaperone function